MAKKIQLPNACPVNPAEAQVIQYLVDQLPNTYTVIPNAEITQPGNPPFEYDAIVIGPHAVYVVEIKRWLGGIDGDDYTWRIAGLHNRPNPWITTNNKARVLKSTIDHRDPGLGRFWVEAVVALADLEGEFNLRGNCRQRTFRYTDLPAFLTDSSRLEGHVSDLRPLRARLENAVHTAARGRPIGPLQFGSYKVLETLSRRDHVSEFLARNQLLPDSPLVRLRAFSYNPYLAPDELDQHQARLRREAEALQKIGYHPNLISLKSFEADPQDPNLFVEVTDWSEGGTLRSLMSSEAALSLERKIELGLDLAAGLKAAHSAGVIHRDLRPENVLISVDGSARLMNFDHARFAVPGAKTVGPLVPEPGISEAYIAPELASPAVAAAPTSDLYSLGMILFELLVGDVLYRTPREALEAAQTCSGPIDFVSDIPASLNILICDLLQIDPLQRPQSAEDVLTRLRELREKPSGTLILPSPPAPPELLPEPEPLEPIIFRVGDLIDGKYTVQKVLKPGGFGQVYKVYDGILEQVFALKIFNPGALALNSLQREARTLNNLDHKNIVKVRTWGRLAQADRLYLVSDFVEGEELTHYTTPETRLSACEVVQVVVDLLSALAYLHPPVDRIAELREKMAQNEITGEEYEEFLELQSQGFLHRDIKPGNLMLSPQGVRLIDFNIAARAAQAGRTYIGTPGYMLPDVGIMAWTTDGDLFATGIVLYELIVGHHPYPPDGIPTIDTEPVDPRSFVPDLSPRFSELLLRAVSCRSDVRYHSANRFRQDLLGLQGDYLQAVLPEAVISIVIQPEEKGLKNYNPFVTRLLKLYSQARQDNSGTRGLDEIGELTYVRTRLDQALQPAILDGQYRLAIITGNAGDGKTAFIQRVEGTVEKAGGYLEHPSPNSSRFQFRGLSFVTNYDGSQDEGAGRANDQVLSEFFAAFDDAHFAEVSAATPVHLIAINEGRLVDFFSEAWSAQGDPNAPAKRFQKLAGLIQRYFERDSSQVHLPDWLLIVDLNQRSVVAADLDAEGTSIFDRQLLAFLKPQFWQACQDCDLRSRCFIKYNVDTLSDSLAGPAVRERLRTLFEIVHLRHQLHITMRDLRSALSWMLFRDHSCEAVCKCFQPSRTADRRTR
jgi:serine/threonine protein kinase